MYQGMAIYSNEQRNTYLGNLIMIRAEVKTTHKSFVFAEDTIEEAKAYTKAMEDNGVEIIKVEYFDLDQRVAAIRAGEV